MNKRITEPPYTLYVDDISADKIKATVSRPYCIIYNIQRLRALEGPTMGESVNGIYLFPVGRYICMVVKSTHVTRAADGMVFLNLGDRSDLAWQISEKFESAELQRKFSVVLTHIRYHPEIHGRFELVKAPPALRAMTFIPPRPPSRS